MYNHRRIMETNTSGVWVTFSRAGFGRYAGDIRF